MSCFKGLKGCIQQHCNLPPTYVLVAAMTGDACTCVVTRSVAGPLLTLSSCRSHQISQPASYHITSVG